ncbi:Dephospho-CoA kinase [subsurface metagenome]
MKVIGLTGGIGSGKSTVSRFLAELGAVIIDTDKVGHVVLEPDSEDWQQVVAAFGRQILKPNREIDRKKLGKIVYGSAKALSRLNRIMQPQICRVVKAQLEQYRRQGIDVVVVEAPLLIEAGWTSLVDEVWVTLAPEATVLKRLKEGMGLSKAESQARIRSQLSAKERVKYAHVVINTDLSLDELKARVNKLWQGL